MFRLVQKFYIATEAMEMVPQTGCGAWMAESLVAWTPPVRQVWRPVLLETVLPEQ